MNELKFEWILVIFCFVIVIGGRNFTVNNISFKFIYFILMIKISCTKIRCLNNNFLYTILDS